MGFSNMLEILQEKNQEKIVLVRLGAFYIATGRDAILLHTKLNLKCTCFKNNICKVGVPINSIEKFSIGNEYKSSTYCMLEKTLYLNKINRKENSKESLNIVNKIDTELNCQRIYLRIMKKMAWIDTKKFDIAMKKIYEIGSIIGGLIKVYGKNNSK